MEERVLQLENRRLLHLQICLRDRIFHEIDIIRNGQTISKLNNSEFQTIRQELDAENYIYDGSLSAVTHISDVRVGDIIAYSFTRKGYNPIHKNYFAEYFQ